MNPVHEHCSSQIYFFFIKLNKNQIKLDKIFRNEIFVDKNV